MASMHSSLITASSSTAIHPKYDLNNKIEKIEQKNWLGHILVISQNGIHFLFHKIERVAANIFFILNNIFADPDSLSKIFNLLEKHVLRWIEEIKGCQGHFEGVKDVMRTSAGCIEAIQIAADIDYFVNVKSKNDSTFNVLGKTSKLIADTGTVVLWLAQLDFITLDKLAAAIGSIGIFKISLKFIVERAFGLTLACFTVDAFYRMIQSEKVIQKAYAGLELANNMSELTLDLMLLSGVTNIVGLGLLASVCICLRASSQFYKLRYKP